MRACMCVCMCMCMCMCTCVCCYFISYTYTAITYPIQSFQDSDQPLPPLKSSSSSSQTTTHTHPIDINTNTRRPSATPSTIDRTQWRARALRELPEIEHLMQQLYPVHRAEAVVKYFGSDDVITHNINNGDDDVATGGGDGVTRELVIKLILQHLQHVGHTRTVKVLTDETDLQRIIHTYIHTHIHTYTHTYIQTQTYIHTYKEKQTHKHTYIHTYTHT